MSIEEKEDYEFSNPNKVVDGLANNKEGSIFIEEGDGFTYLAVFCVSALAIGLLYAGFKKFFETGAKMLLPSFYERY